MEEYNQKLVCPVCNHQYDCVHFEKPILEGDFIKIPMYCEEDHKWNLILEHHKGETFIYCESKDVISFKTKTND